MKVLGVIFNHCWLNGFYLKKMVSNASSISRIVPKVRTQKQMQKIATKDKKEPVKIVENTMMNIFFIMQALYKNMWLVT